MPIFHVKPVLALLDDPAWRDSAFQGECWVNAADAAEARGLASGRYEDARANIPGHSSGPSPWQDERLVTVEPMDAPPPHMQIPAGVVVSDRQL